MAGRAASTPGRLAASAVCKSQAGISGRIFQNNAELANQQPSKRLVSPAVNGIGNAILAAADFSESSRHIFAVNS
jgi:hypothetical protein